MFQKGRAKTGGRVKNGPVKKSNKFVDQLKNHGFNYPKELAQVLLEIKKLRASIADPKTAAASAVILAELKYYYSELKFLLPVMAPKLREREVDTVDEDPEDKRPSTPVSDEDLLKALENGSETKPLPRTNHKAPVGAGNSQPQVSASSEEDPSSLAGEQEED